MKKVRIGNDIAIEWSIYRLGEGEILQDKKVEVKILDPKMMPVPFSYEIVENKIIGVFEGRIQKCVGAYTLLLLENCGKLHMNTLDECNFVQLVPHSYMEGGKDESSITTEKIELSTDIEIPTNGLDGDSAYDIWIKLGHQGTEEDFIAWLQQPAINAANEAQEQMALFAEKEAVRDDAELERVANEETRKSNEQERIRVENVRENAEARRKENDRVMREHETERMQAEDQRVLAEQKRNINEDARQSQEATRISNENQRIKNEAKRKSVVRTSKLKTEGLVDTYIIVYSDGSFDTFKVTNGKDGETPDVSKFVQLNEAGILPLVDNTPIVVHFYDWNSTPVAGANINLDTNEYEIWQLKRVSPGLPPRIHRISSEYLPNVGLLFYNIDEEMFFLWTGAEFEEIHTGGGGGDAYTKAETDALLAGKASATSLVQMEYEEEPVEVDTNLAISLMSTGINNHIHDTTEALATKADKDGFKTINGESIVGSGDITIEGGTEEIYIGTGTPPEDAKIAINPNENFLEVTDELGDATDKVMSQKAVTDALAGAGGGGGLRPLFIAAGAVYNSTTGYYKLNGLTDITEEEMLQIYNIGKCDLYSVGAGSYIGNPSFPSYTLARTNLGRKGNYNLNYGTMLLNGYFAYSTSLVVVNLTTRCPYNNGYIQPSSSVSVTNMFTYCNNLTTIQGIMDFGNITAYSNTFRQCYALESLTLKGLKANISFADSPNLSKDSILYIINNSAATSAITITLHPTAYAMAQADTEIQTALSNHPFITLASA